MEGGTENRPTQLPQPVWGGASRLLISDSTMPGGRRWRGGRIRKVSENKTTSALYGCSQIRVYFASPQAVCSLTDEAPGLGVGRTQSERMTGSGRRYVLFSHCCARVSLIYHSFSFPFISSMVLSSGPFLLFLLWAGVGTLERIINTT